jgi:hypothetical protein
MRGTLRVRIKSKRWRRPQLFAQPNGAEDHHGGHHAKIPFGALAQSNLHP